jgi:iron transport multicopper oxidase
VYQDAYTQKSAKYATPGVGPNGIYIGTGDGSVVGYGAPVTRAIAAKPVDFGAVLLGLSVTQNVVLRATQATQVTAMTTNTAAYTLSTPPALPVALGAGASLTVPVTFTPVKAGGYPGALAVVTTTGTVGVSLEGQGETAGPDLVVSPKSLTFGGTPPGSFERLNLVLENRGMQALQFTGIEAPRRPFTVTGGPAIGDVVPPGAAVTLSVTYAPETTGTYKDSLSFTTNGGNPTVYMSGSSAPPGALVISPTTVDCGSVPVGSTSTCSFTLSNVGGSRLTITRSKPPSSPQFVAQTELDEGATIPAGYELTEKVEFQPTSAAPFQDTWQITGSTSSGAITVKLTGIGVDGPDASTE